jgi:hypothetical protein
MVAVKVVLWLQHLFQETEAALAQADIPGTAAVAAELSQQLVQVEVAEEVTETQQLAQSAAVAALEYLVKELQVQQEPTVH